MSAAYGTTCLGIMFLLMAVISGDVMSMTSLEDSHHPSLQTSMVHACRLRSWASSIAFGGEISSSSEV